MAKNWEWHAGKQDRSCQDHSKRQYTGLQGHINSFRIIGWMSSHAKGGSFTEEVETGKEKGKS